MVELTVKDAQGCLTKKTKEQLPHCDRKILVDTFTKILEEVQN